MKVLMVLQARSMAAAVAVGHVLGIAEVKYVLVGEAALELLGDGEAAHSAVYDSDG